MKLCGRITSIYEEAVSSKFAPSPVRPSNLEKVPIQFLINSKGKSMGQNSRNKQNNRRRQFFQLIKVQSLLKRPKNNLPNLQQKYGNTKQIILKSVRKGIL
jgi:hypothetical protein